MRNMDSFTDTCPECGCEMTMRFFHPIKTNADRIRAMSDEELAEWIWREPTIGYFAVCPPGIKDGGDCPTSPCEQCWLDWLKATVEEVQDGT